MYNLSSRNRLLFTLSWSSSDKSLKPLFPFSSKHSGWLESSSPEKVTEFNVKPKNDFVNYNMVFQHFFLVFIFFYFSIFHSSLLSSPIWLMIFPQFSKSCLSKLFNECMEFMIFSYKAVNLCFCHSNVFTGIFVGSFKFNHFVVRLLGFQNFIFSQWCISSLLFMSHWCFQFRYNSKFVCPQGKHKLSLLYIPVWFPIFLL